MCVPSKYVCRYVCCVLLASMYAGMCVVCCVYANVNVLARYVGTSLTGSQLSTKQPETQLLGAKATVEML